MNYPQFDRASNNSPLGDDELEAFDELLLALPADGAMTLEGVDGYLTAMLLGPAEWLDQRPTADWLPLIWGGDGPNGEPFASNRQRKRATLFTLRHLQAIACQLRDHPKHWEPLFSIVEANGEEWVDAQDWCTGFLQAVDLQPDAWADWQADAELGPGLATIALLGDDELPDTGSEEAQALADPAARDAMAREVFAAVLAMHARRHGAPR
ncbi:MAG TPA: UPF0149 family protein [Ideonella sp.]|uniref:UPF0149 family protein n=1 Tax=Ideonella sp. TaxID=1929293 RepID=UPI002E33ADEF|nr:UPF0149 family protein [Ideonella sp.]HEX5683233.1 UPF0149 family protein [Ideonella sp.]